MSDIAQPTHPVAIGEPAVYAAVVAFIKDYAGIGHVYQGWQNRSALPAGTNVYAVVSLLLSIPLNTPIERMTDDDDIYEVSRLNELQVQVDICGEDDSARQQAQMLHLAASSSIGIQFFNEHEMSVLYADDVRDISFVGDAQQFVRRYMLTLHLSAWNGFTVNYDGFNKARAHLEDVDMHHHPKEV
jgi:hypothetical protein